MKASWMVLVALCIAAVALPLGGDLFAEEGVGATPAAPSKPVTVSDCKTKQPPVTFNHTEHMQALQKLNATGGCQRCHHTGKVGAPCGSCHKQAVGNLGTCTVAGRTNPFHAMCIGCHEQAAKNPDPQLAKAPTKCAGCHVKQ